MAEQWRAIVALPVAANSPLGRAGDAAEAVTTHLPPPEEHARCAVCRTRPWPCDPFDTAVRALAALGIPVGYLVPLDLHPVLWPPATPTSDQPTLDMPGALDG
ncbi:hypothetical protein [Saccharothrix syringae]|uniref:Uncharacterized protein n=1 Tax=Saccharothrix syringae TaxID=103733 RepID=A0A5Q0H3Y1_SACSY|nr:hypothetical protein [Saccharothrix syringae]QFZ20510.1 hypothetical protein EKG83_26650 [Saccharothrix syringae]